ncbi:MAG: hypothetical protein H0V30_08400, partial [Chitinophagaceae bacterium]|nr:hypothetical protein [Chitinophagaceae bacterium]
MIFFSKQLAKKEDKHGFRLTEIVDLPDAARRPKAVFRSKTSMDTLVVVTDLKKDGSPIAVAIAMDNGSGDNVVNSIYTKEGSTKIASWITDGLREWVDKEKTLKFLDNSQANSVSSAILREAVNIKQNFEKPDHAA